MTIRSARFERRLASRSAARATVFVVLTFMILPRAFRPLFRFLTASGRPPPEAAHRLFARLLLPSDLTLIASALAAASLMLLAEPGGLTARRLIARSNLPWRPACGRQVVAGALLGMAAMAAIMAMLAAFGHARIILTGASPGEVVATLIVFAFTFALVGLAEELAFRGYAQRALTEGVGFWAASLLTSAWFAWTHLAEGDPWYGALGTGLRGFFDCLTLRASGSIAFAIGFHAAWDYTESALFGVPDSSYTIENSLAATRLHGPIWLTGGPVGPEGSVIAYATSVALVLAALPFARRAPASDRSACGP